jgi:hypothetical protein
VDGLPVTSHSSRFGGAVYTERCLLMEARLQHEISTSAVAALNSRAKSEVSRVSGRWLFTEFGQDINSR